MKIRVLVVVVAVALIALVHWTSLVVAAGGTSQVVSKGSKVGNQEDWPKGLEAFLNLEFRTDGWNPWFSEWPNDVTHYQFGVKSTDQANAVIAEFAKIKAEKLYVRLSTGKEPANIGWVSRIKEGNNTALLFTMGSQKRLDEWFARLGGGKFGVMEFAAAPTAVPPTLTIFVENEAIELDKLSIPAGLVVEAGSTPGLFHASNQKVDPTKPPPAPGKPAEVDEKTKKVMARIEKYLAGRKRPA